MFQKRPNTAPPSQYPEQRIDLLNILAISHGVEIERHLSEIRAQRGQLHDARDCFQRLGQTIQDASADLASLRVPDDDHGGRTRDTLENTLTQQLVLITTQLEDVEEQIAYSFGAVPTPPPGGSSPNQPPPRVPLSPQTPPDRDALLDTLTVSGNHIQTPRPANDGIISLLSPPRDSSKYEPWPTADPNYAAPALEPITFQGQHGSSPRLPGDMSGAAHIGRQTDEQENKIEAEKVAGWKAQIGEDKFAPDIPDNPRKRPRDELQDTPNKKPHVNEESVPTGLWGGQNQGEGGWGFKNLLKIINPFPSKVEDQPTYTVANDHIINPHSTTPQVRAHQDPEQGRIRISALRTDFHPSDHHAKATRDALGDLIALFDSSPHRLHPDDHRPRQGSSRQRIQTLLDALNAIHVEYFDVADTRLGMEELRRYIDTTNRARPRNRAEEAEKEAALAGAAASVAELYETLDWQVQFAAKVFVGGEETAGVFADWIRNARENFAEELEFGERASQVPKGSYQGRGFGRHWSGEV
ncbi:hypothetical protein CkaCkLH20_12159 [Colletotrichum karsti]|uniref:Uncharacterized protein n=1 Tax=Colletotrichum karsti TaxID=1095194 RepID=A0A9P6HT01_9PEZI|nr:uncharacterized protein CkaCkLH20_12159 [Colletotrichum karsti]KAF9870312.1 hypothetical protein CkaCkLH20_12159 [Colletotrichum karsti]